MKIDAFTIIIQMLNFFILMWILKKYLYRPITNAMDAREKEIQKRLKAGKIAESKADKERLKLEEMQASFEEYKIQKEDELEDWASAERQKLNEKLDIVETEKREGIHQSLQKESEDFYNSMKEKVSGLFEKEISSAIKDLSDETLEERITKLFISKLSNKDYKRKQGINLKENTKEAIKVLTSYTVSKEDKAEIEKIVKSENKNNFVEFSHNKERSTGIEIIINSKSIAWNVESYTKNFKKAIDKAINASYKVKK
ncbi:MAG: hypothetical protein N4A44_01045 [Alphaproteobacteria bacterium]|jgi:F-type H+-transporting ATPase subunit b|nr:hypothetical protein [Alphaproteobacteria bacterium]